MGQLKNIKLVLSSRTNVPVEVEYSNVYDFVKLSDLTVYYSNNIIVFIFILVNQHDLSLYKLIPLPVCATGSTKSVCILDISKIIYLLQNQKYFIQLTIILNPRFVNLYKRVKYVPKSIFCILRV